MNTPPDAIPDDLETLRAAYLSERAARQAAEATIAHLKLMIAKLNHAKYGPSAERSRICRQSMQTYATAPFRQAYRRHRRYAEFLRRSDATVAR